MRAKDAAVVVGVLLFVIGCDRRPDVDAVPVGSNVQLTRQDGALVEGTLTERDAASVRVDIGPTTRSVPRSEIADLRVKAADESAELPRAARFREVALSEETPLAIRLDSAVGSAISRVETPVRGELAEPVVVDGVHVLPAGADVRGQVTQAQPSGKVKGRASLELRFQTLSTGGETYPLDARFARTAPATKVKDAQKIGIPAAGGAVIGAILGGKKGAAIGAAAGGGAGTAVVLSTAGKEIELDQGTILSLHAGRTLVVRVPIKGN